MPERKRICIVVSSIGTVEAFLLGHLAAMGHTHDVCLVANCRDRHYLQRRGLDIDLLYAPLTRNVSPIRDTACLLMLVWMLRRRKFDVVHSVTPKAGLLAMVAARLARIPVRVHTFTGQVWATRAGTSRWMLKALDRILATCATHILVDSRSQLQFLTEERVVSPPKASVLAKGSISGVDTNRFRPEPRWREEIRAALGIPPYATVFAYVGRLKTDKGVLDLAAAFSRLCQTEADVYLTFVGTDEENLRTQIQRRCAPCADRLRFVDWTATPELYMASADTLCLPSYREGFGSVIVEAAACEVPSLASAIYGVTDAVVDGVTGILHEPGNVQALTAAMRRAVRNPQWRIALGKRARVRAQRDFGNEVVTAALLSYYGEILGSAGQGPSDEGHYACGR